jgi:hypothetical protein
VRLQLGCGQRAAEAGGQGAARAGGGEGRTSRCCASSEKANRTTLAVASCGQCSTRSTGVRLRATAHTSTWFSYADDDAAASSTHLVCGRTPARRVCKRVNSRTSGALAEHRPVAQQPFPQPWLGGWGGQCTGQRRGVCR